jgi:hypothetical protein
MKFSIIVPHYDLSISDEIFNRGIQCLLDQSYPDTDFEVLIYHDGPVSRPVPTLYYNLRNKNFTITDKRMNDWGHSNRDRGIKEAKGEYIIHFNPDNILYPNALKEISDKLNEECDPRVYTKNIVIFPILMMGMQTNGKLVWRVSEIHAKNHYMIFTGFPSLKYNIDAMQLVMSRKVWIDYGGWYDKSKESDGNMYPKFVYENGARYCNKILGEHW